MSDTINITILNYEKFNGRKDVKTNSWFKCSNRLLEDSDFFAFSHGEFLVWIYILSIASQKGESTFCLNLEHCDRIARLGKKLVFSALEKLEQLQLVEISRNVDVTDPLRVRNVDVTPDKIRLDKIREEEIRMSDSAGRVRVKFNLSESKLNAVYQEYPRKEGKSKGFEIAKREIKSEQDLQDLTKSIKNYKSMLTEKNTDPKYIKMFSTFMNSWRDCLDSEFGKAEVGDSMKEKMKRLFPEENLDG